MTTKSKKLPHRRKPPHRSAGGPTARGEAALAATRLEVVRQVARVLAHENRNIAGSFTTCLELLRRNPQLGPSDRELLDIMQWGTMRLSEIADQFSTFGHGEPLRFEWIDLHAIVDEVLVRLRRDKRCSTSVEMAVQIPPAMTRVWGDRRGLATILWQLCLNAAQAMGDRGRLEIAAQARRRTLKIVVRDDGAGVSDELREKIFQPLFTTKTRATGLGLTIARRIAEAHGGTLELCRDSRRTTGFVVELPLQEEGRPKRSRKRR